jgi:aspartyl-tRNA(Asn)/glutamyl-tRNA(Gln) amidotransferase subunit B
LEKKYELVCGLETHIELSTNTKMFCSCGLSFGAEPNTKCCPVCVGLPGALPTINAQAIEYAVMMGLALGSEINLRSFMERKNYFYPDLPKAYQISQGEKPICAGGCVVLSNGRKIKLNHIHIEEDAGKLSVMGSAVFIDYNRGGTPLIEIVSEPEIQSSMQAREYIEKLQTTARYLNISDVRMQEGSMRCDVNVSVRRAGEKKFGTRVEIKNMNSIAFICKAIEYEFMRQIEELENGGTVVQETRRYDEKDGTTEPMREKENAMDYRYFPEPDLKEIVLTEEYIENLKKNLPEPPEKKMLRYVNGFGITEKIATLIVKYSKVANFFDEASKGCESPKSVANLIVGTIFAHVETETAKEEFELKINPDDLRYLVNLVFKRKLSAGNAKEILAKLLETGSDVKKITDEFISANKDFDLEAVCDEAIAMNPKPAQDVRSGIKKALQVILGGVMKLTRGRANALEAEKILKEKLT